MATPKEAESGEGAAGGRTPKAKKTSKGDVISPHPTRRRFTQVPPATCGAFSRLGSVLVASSSIDPRETRLGLGTAWLLLLLLSALFPLGEREEGLGMSI